MLVEDEKGEGGKETRTAGRGGGLMVGRGTE